ncbi:MAG: SUMF1/EgtB/PvdO family nonheme iron enzyme, partial [Chloroflexi bacterium]|nr:SUMF1/EgtB/PvdO family nonheme iron enzyme [Chloroflexota bacterium]
ATGQANFCDSNCSYDWKNTDIDDGYAQTSPVGEYEPNGYGVYDMAGNIWEWVEDWYDSGYYAVSPTENPTGPESGDYRVLRGGSWSHNGSDLRVAYRYNYAPSSRHYSIGFRCARSVSP